MDISRYWVSSLVMLCQAFTAAIFGSFFLGHFAFRLVFSTWKACALEFRIRVLLGHLLLVGSQGAFLFIINVLTHPIEMSLWLNSPDSLASWWLAFICIWSSCWETTATDSNCTFYNKNQHQTFVGFLLHWQMTGQEAAEGDSLKGQLIPLF